MAYFDGSFSSGRHDTSEYFDGVLSSCVSAISSAFPSWVAALTGLPFGCLINYVSFATILFHKLAILVKGTYVISKQTRGAFTFCGYVVIEMSRHSVLRSSEIDRYLNNSDLSSNEEESDEKSVEDRVTREQFQ